MNTSRKLALASISAVTAAAMATAALAQATATTSATASATVAQPIAVAKTSDLQFGRVIRPSAGNTTIYTVAASSGATSTSGGDGIFSGNATPTRAVFTVTGEGGQAFNISSDPSITTGGVTITLVRSGGTGTLDGTAGALGTATFGVGGNVTLTDASPTGVKSGSFNVTVTYQ
ncbi:MAG: hypothetical protein JWP49_2164 [Phenylobacterium sp.]|nr:hypothetical protein [Phenylobacterium sp.]